MDSGTICFAHGNGFPAGTYRRLHERWRAAGWRVVAPERFGHDPARPPTSNWPHLEAELAAFVAREAPGGAVLVGHSLGGILSLMVACRHPPLARALVMLDAPVITGWRAGALRAAKASGLISRFSPGRLTRRRRNVWSDRAEAHAHYRSRGGFAAWHPDVLGDYVESGVHERGGRAELAFDRGIETRIYDTLPHDIGALLRRHPPRCPVAFVAGRDSAEMRQGGSAASRRLAGARYVEVDGGHLFPMERPDETADLVLRLIGSMRTPSVP